jgi:hypothetical protein
VGTGSREENASKQKPEPPSDQSEQRLREALDGSASVPGESENHSHAGREAISAVKLSERLSAGVDAWAEAHNTVRSDAIRQLLELGLSASSARPPHEGRSVRDNEAEIEQQATAQIDLLLDPSLPPDERERRRRRLIEGPPEFSGERLDLPKHQT